MQNKSTDIIITNKAARPLGAYPHARKAGNLLFLSGIGSRKVEDNQIPGIEVDENGNKCGHDIVAECHQVFANVKDVLEASGSSWSNIIDVTVFLTDMKNDFEKFNNIYKEYFEEVLPSRTTVEVKSLPSLISIELKVIALVS